MSKTPQPLIQVALSVPLNRLFDYHCSQTTEIGARVLVPFGTRKLVGLVVRHIKKSDFPADKIKSVIQVLDDTPVLDMHQLALCKSLAQYYQAPIGEAYFLAIPKLLRKLTRKTEKRINYIWQSHGSKIDAKIALSKAKKQWQLWQFIHEFPNGINNSELNNSFGGWHNFANNLLKKNLLIRHIELPNHKPDTAKTLNAEQQKTCDAIINTIGQFAVHLLYGVTGSGKTEVYLHAIAPIIAAGKQVIILIPEISLSPQTSGRFKQRFNIPLEVQHSKLTDADRLTVWQNCKEKKAKILITTRSGLFTPMPDCGLIIVDEEHDASFKQQDGIRYSARDMAIVRAKKQQIPVVLGSATPSLESIHNAKSGHYKWLALTKRAGGAQTPKWFLDDIGKTQSAISNQSLAAIKSTLSKGLQAMVFVNRRGYSPAMYCPDCTEVVQCPHCHAAMTVHKYPPKMICHHCEHCQDISTNCPTCHADQIQMIGAGTEKIEQQLKAMFPKQSIHRIDRDTMNKKQAWLDLFEVVHSEQTGVLIGTQMIAKGHHFPRVALVVVVGSDQGLHSSDFRATEHLAQLIVQISGRAGRAEHPGKVIIQTRYPMHPLWQTLMKSGYLSLCDILLNEREQSRFPPFKRMCVYRSQAPKADDAKSALWQIKQQIDDDQIEVLGPIPAPLEKKKDSFQMQLILQAPDKQYLRCFLAKLQTKLPAFNGNKKLRVSLDVDPFDLT